MSKASSITSKNEERVVLKFLWSRIAEHKKWIFFSFVFAGGAAIVQFLTADLVRNVMDKAFIAKDWHRLVSLALTAVGLFFFDNVTDFFHRICLRVGMERTIRKMRRELFERFLVHSSEQTTRSNSGEAVTRLISDTAVIGQGLHVVADLLREPLILIALLVKLFMLSWRLSIVCFVAVPLIGSVGRVLGRSARRNQGRIQRTLDVITSHINETLRGLRTAHAFNQTAKLREEFRDQTDESYRWLVRLARVEETSAPLTKTITSWIGAGILLFAGWLVIHGDMTPGDALAFIIAAGLLQQPLRQLNEVNVRLQVVIASGRRIHDVINEPLDDIGEAQRRILESPVTDSTVTIAAPLTRASSALEFSGLSYRYPTGADGSTRDWALRQIDLNIPAGRKLAVVGRSGSGKTTLSLLAMRFIDPTEGHVRLDGKSAREWDLADYRAHFGHVSQDVFLFNRSVRDNLRFAKPGASDAEILSALDKASIREFVEALPRGLDTNLAEHASNLSGGERQRLAIARAFLKDAPFLILDEATSQLDALSEMAVQKALQDLMRNRSVLLIAHRLATIREADEVAVFEGGRIAERGKPQALLANPQGAFAELWSAQTQPAHSSPDSKTDPDT